MVEQGALQALGGFGEWIWGDDAETTVFAQAFGDGKTLIFRFVVDHTEPESLATRVVNYFHDLETIDTRARFLDWASMRTEIWSSVATVWDECSDEPTVEDPDVVINIYEARLTDDAPPQAMWKICHEVDLFNKYADLLLPQDQLLVKHLTNTVDFKGLVRQHQLGGRGCTTFAHMPSSPQTKYVFKGIDFRTFLFGYESGHIREEVKIFYRSMELVCNMPPHPNVMSPAQTLVTICKEGDDRPLVCGSLYPFIPKGTLASNIEHNNQYGRRIPLSQKSKWCYQMAAAVAHTHIVAHTYHMDIKPGNFLLDEESNLVLIDWEQSDAPVTTTAPEIDGTWDVEEIPSEDQNTTLRYTKYTGSERRNMPITTPGNHGWNIWNVFLEWEKHCPKALELAEVFSLGRSMWMLLRQPDLDGLDDIARIEDVVEDWESAEDIPEQWKRVVENCLHKDPNKRIGLRELVDFWNSERQAMYERDT
ncbi:hypothetical protein V501_08021 [Pseudogymnoascus sp. VKM F-4519 (FW-2642)]|nr:hypothetical protein V501_08021 [Pseudogymnoascus sp. VKM F-4519 (FW-2642)]